MASISRSAVMDSLKIDPAHMKLLDMLEIKNQLNPHRPPLSLSNVRELLGLEALTNKIAAKDAKDPADPKGKRAKFNPTSTGSPYLRFPSRPRDSNTPTGLVAGPFPTGMVAGFPTGIVAVCR